jgi:hypothetical protein
MEEFLDSIFADHQDNLFAQRMRTALPMLPNQPSGEQIDAWVELAGLVQDSEFRARIREVIVEGERQPWKGLAAHWFPAPKYAPFNS